MQSLSWKWSSLSFPTTCNVKTGFTDTSGEDGRDGVWAGGKGAGRRPEKVPLLPKEREQLRCEVL